MIISVASGKGGTGKTLVSTSLVLSLKGRGEIQLLDCDVEEPNDYIFLRPAINASEPVSIPVPKVDKENCSYCGKCAEVCNFNAIAAFPQHVLVFPNLCHGCGACRYFCPQGAIIEEDRQVGVVEWGQAYGVDFVQGTLNVGEAMPTPVIRRVKERVKSEGIVIIDVSPGTSCPMVEAIRGSDFCLLVTEPTPFGLNDLALAVETVKKLEIPCGVVINRAGVGNELIEDYCRQENVPVMLTIPLDTAIAQLYSRGITLCEGIPQWKERFSALFSQIQEACVAGNSCLKR